MKAESALFKQITRNIGPGAQNTIEESTRFP